MTMQLSAAGAAFVRHHEGFVPSWYRDPVGVGTIGIGFTWRSDAFRRWWAEHRPGQAFAPGARMTRDEADDVLQLLVAEEYGAAVNAWWTARKALAQNEFDAAASVVYNLGERALEWKWAAALKAGDIAGAAALLKKTGTTAEGRELAGLVSRRREEAELLELGDYSIGPVVYTAPAMADGVLRRRERGAEVLDLQRKLKARGLYDGTLDGIFGHGTEAAVLAFQRAAGLVADGVAGPKTMAALDGIPMPSPADEVLPAPAPDPVPRERVEGEVIPPRRKTIGGALGGLVTKTWINYIVVAAATAFATWLTSIGVAPEWADVAREAIVKGFGEYLTGGSIVAALLVAGKFALNGIREAAKPKAVIDGKRIPLDTPEKKARVKSALAPTSLVE